MGRCVGMRRLREAIARHARCLLERRFPQHWGPRQVIQTEGESEPPLTLLRLADLLDIEEDQREHAA